MLPPLFDPPCVGYHGDRFREPKSMSELWLAVEDVDGTAPPKLKFFCADEDGGGLICLGCS